jgi:ribosomal protein S18 acetylase RimI-like enzyme
MTEHHGGIGPISSSVSTHRSTSPKITTESIRNGHHNKNKNNRKSNSIPPPPQPQYPISLRLAQYDDIPWISSCNLQTLPENYNDAFYTHHLSENPYLSIVAVIEKNDENHRHDDDSERRPIHGNYDPNQNHRNSKSPTNFWQRQLQLAQHFWKASMVVPQQQYYYYNYNYNNIDPNSHHQPVCTAPNNNNVLSVASSQQLQQQQQHNSYDRRTHGENENQNSQNKNSKQSIVVGYLLGKITLPQEPYQCLLRNRNNSVPPPSSSSSSSYTTSNTAASSSLQQQQQQQQQHIEMIGHVSSLAVLPEARQRGIAQALLQQFHYHLQQQPPPTSSNRMNGNSDGSNRNSSNNNIMVTSTGLHVRCSNVAAVRLYEKLGYVPAITIPAYYDDGEDAYYMQKVLLNQQHNNINNNKESLITAVQSTPPQQPTTTSKLSSLFLVGNRSRSRSDGTGSASTPVLPDKVPSPLEQYQLPRVIGVFCEDKVDPKDVDDNDGLGIPTMEYPDDCKSDVIPEDEDDDEPMYI